MAFIDIGKISDELSDRIIEHPNPSEAKLEEWRKELKLSELSILKNSTDVFVHYRINLFNVMIKITDLRKTAMYLK